MCVHMCVVTSLPAYTLSPRAFIVTDSEVIYFKTDHHAQRHPGRLCRSCDNWSGLIKTYFVIVQSNSHYNTHTPTHMCTLSALFIRTGPIDHPTLVARVTLLLFKARNNSSHWKQCESAYVCVCVCVRVPLLGGWRSPLAHR